MLPDTLRAAHGRFSGIVAGVLALGIIFAATPALSARADDGISVAPADGSGVLDQTRSRFSYGMAPGQQLTDQVLVSNTGSTALDVTVFATDAFNSDTGAFSLLDTGSPSKDAGTWISFAGAPQIDLHLNPGEKTGVEFTVAVPAAAAPGDHPGGIVVSTLDSSGQILLDRRVATRMYLRIAGDLQPLLSMSGLDAAYRAQLNPFDGALDTTLTLANTGNVALGGTLLLTPTTWFGIPVGPAIRQDVSELLPGSTRAMTHTFTAVPEFGLVGVSARLQPSSTTGTPLTVPVAEVSRDVSGFVMPWWILVLVGLALGAVVFVRLRRRRDARLTAQWMAYTEGEARRRADEQRTEVGAGSGT